MKDIAIYGAGGLGREIYCMIDLVNKGKDKEEQFQFIGFFDDGIENGKPVSHFGSVLGGMEELNAWDKPLSLVIAIGDPRSRYSVSSRIKNPNINFPNLIHPSFTVADLETFKIGKGNVITGDCSATVNVIIGDFNLFNGYIVMGHDVTIGNHNVFMPAIHISGEIVIGNQNKFGVGSILIQQLKIGNGVTIGAGAVLFTKPKDGGTYIGNPAKLFKF